MRLARRLIAVALVACASALALAQPQAPPQGAAGHWVGSIISDAGIENPFTLTLVRDGDAWSGFTSGLTETGDVPLTSASVNASSITFRVQSPSSLGPVSLEGELTLDGTRLSGIATIAVGSQRQSASLSLERRNRRDVAQPQVRQRIDYFAGRWEFEYVGGEFPPLSAGPRTGTAAFALVGDSFVRGELTADLGGTGYREEIMIGFDPGTKSLTFLERKPGGVELLSVATWESPIAIRFVTSPVQAEGRTWQLRRLLSVTSDVAFSMAEEYAVDGGPFRRLGSARFTKVR